ncbi:gliding motility-associated C-terminal domain-containing protein, partial [Mangrovimonas spongiae]
ELPAFTVPASETETVDCLADAVQPTAPVVADACGNDITPVITENADPACEGAKVYTFTYTDCANNEAVYTYTYNIELPAFTVPASETETVDCLADAVQPTAPVVADACGNDITPVITENADPACEGAKVYTFTYTDCANNEAVYTYTYNIELPAFTVPNGESSTVTCIDDAQAVPTPPEVQDACGNMITPTGPIVSNDPTCDGVKTYTWNYTDCAGNSNDWTYTYNINDNINPTIDIAASDLIVECDGSGNNGAIQDWLDNNGGAQATDNCGDVTWTNNYNGADSDCSTPVDVIFTATDECGNSITTTASYAIQDTTAPVISTEASNETVECGGDGNITDLNDWLTSNGGAVVSDDCSAITWSNDFTALSSECGATGFATVTFTATDGCGNESTTTATFTIEDTNNPTFSVPQDITIECDQDATDLTLTGDVTDEADNCSADIEATYTDSVADGNCPSESIITRTWTLVDDCDNTTTQTQTINVVDTTNPTFSVPQDITIECDQDPTDLTLTGDVTDEADNCSADIEATYTDNVADGNCPSESIITRTWTLVDDCGNTTTQTQTINVVDTTNPTFSVPQDITIECDQDPTDLTLTGDVTDEADNCSADIEATYTDSVADGNCPSESIITRTWTLVDDCDNTTTQTQTINVVDTTNPTFSVPQDITIECDQDPTDLTLTGDVTDEADNCSADIEATYTDNVADGNCPSESIITRTWTLVDDCGNTTTQTQTINVVDTTNPTFSVPQDITIECDQDPTDLTLTGDVTDEADNCSADIEATYTDSVADGNCPSESIITRTWTLVDDCGNTTTQTQTINVVDTTNPTFSVPQDITIECDQDPTDLTLTGDVTDEADNCSADIEATYTDSVADGNCPSESIITRTWTLVDDCGNTTTQTQTINVADTTAPEVLNDLSDIFVSCDEIPSPPTLEFSDCSEVTIVDFSENSTFDGTNNDYEIVWSWSVIDACGNKASFNQSVFVSVYETVTQLSETRCIDDGAIDLYSYVSNINIPWQVQSGNISLSDIVDGYVLPSTLEIGTYVLNHTTETEYGCVETTELTINLHDDCIVLPSPDCERSNVEISKAITPNGDQWNEYFEITGVEECGFTVDVKIFNRWGAMIFEANNYQNNWNGQAHKAAIGNADKVPTGTYYYIVNLRNSGFEPFTGHIYVGTK